MFIIYNDNKTLILRGLRQFTIQKIIKIVYFQIIAKNIILKKLKKIFFQTLQK